MHWMSNIPPWKAWLDGREPCTSKKRRKVRDVNEKSFLLKLWLAGNAWRRILYITWWWSLVDLSLVDLSLVDLSLVDLYMDQSLAYEIGPCFLRKS